MTKNIKKLTPHLTYKVWGGEKLSRLKNIETSEPLGETWEVSTHSDGSSILGDLKLKDICNLSYLVKFIDTSDNLSIQVHPDTQYARENENSLGKEECWLILAAEKGAGVYCGFKPGVTRKEFLTAVSNKLNVDRYLEFYPVKKGDFFYIPAGTIHAIGKDVTLCEVQQNSGITYRVWDWNRVGMNGLERELHIEKASDVIRFDDQFNQKLKSHFKQNLFNENGITNLFEHRDFKVQLLKFDANHKFELRLKPKDSIILIHGEFMGDIDMKAFESAIVLEEGLFSFQVKDQAVELLVVSE